MKIKIDILYFKGCPNVDKARNNIKEALSQCSLPLEWNEIDVEDKNTPSYLKGFSSPSILINGIDVATGLSRLEGTSSCKVGGVLEVSKIINVLQEQTKKRSFLAFIAALPATVIAVSPSLFCPACYPAIAALLSSLGLGFFASEAILHPLTIVFLLIALLGLFYQSYKLRRYETFILGVLGAFGIYSGHYLFPSKMLTYGSVVLLIGVSISNLVLRKRRIKKEECNSCKI